jgi:hypothetical protein
MVKVFIALIFFGGFLSAKDWCTSGQFDKILSDCGLKKDQALTMPYDSYKSTVGEKAKSDPDYECALSQHAGFKTDKDYQDVTK